MAERDTVQFRRAATVLAIRFPWNSDLQTVITAIKDAALELDGLVRTNFPDDALYVVTFGAHAKVIEHDELPHLAEDDWTLTANLHQALLVGKELLEPHADVIRRIIVLSDGKVNALQDPERGYPYFAFAPSPIIIRETSRAIRECAEVGIIVTMLVTNANNFLVHLFDRTWDIGSDPDVLKRVSVHAVTPAELGQWLIRDYLYVKTPYYRG